MATTSRHGVAYGAWLLLASSLAGLIVAAINTFNEGNGIAYSLGAYIVLVSTALLLVASLLITFLRGMPRWLSGIILFLILLDLLGTAAAAYFLLAYWLLALMGVGLIAWLIHLFADPASGKKPNHAANREAMPS